MAMILVRVRLMLAFNAFVAMGKSGRQFVHVFSNNGLIVTLVFWFNQMSEVVWDLPVNKSILFVEFVGPTVGPIMLVTILA